MENRLRLALERMEFARGYTLRLLDAVPETDWFRMPAAGVSHVAWQGGHLAMAQYYLVLERIRGAQPEDEATISASFLRAFDRGSTPSANPSDYPTVAEIRATMARVHARALAELPALSPEEFDAPPRRPHPVFDTKLGAVEWCSQHEMTHAGQIGLLRRQHGAAPIW